MSQIVVSLVIALVVFWFRSARKNRARWLKQLNLPGAWDLEDSRSRRMSLEIRGTLSSGIYRFKTDNRNETGKWRITGNSIVFSLDGGNEERCELRLFDSGRIGINGPQHVRQIYLKRADNIVPLRNNS
ncbi:MAG: hypothetical protein VX211_00365 [Pseudomonadota bacterium]|nr:hypothetical protein [Pseudomonadota bacterium]